MSHFKKVCEIHPEVTYSQCRCPGPKTVTEVPCQCKFLDGKVRRSNDPIFQEGWE